MQIPRPLAAPAWLLDYNRSIEDAVTREIARRFPGDLTFEMTDDTTLTVSARGSDNVVRSATITLS